MKNLRARWALFEYSSAYFSEKIFTALDIYDSGLGMVRQKLLIWKKWNLLKSELKNFTHISDIHFWKFHGFKPMGVSCLNPSEMDILGLILDGNNRQLFIPSQYQSPPPSPLPQPYPKTPRRSASETPNPKWPCDFDNYKRLSMIRYFTIWTWIRICGVISCNKIRNYKNSKARLYFFLIVENW